MRKKNLICIFTLLTFGGYSQKNPPLLKDTVLWSADYRLTKEDFKAKPHGSYYGLTESALLMSSREDKGMIKFVVKAVFIRSRSWLKTDSEHILKHEQGHFDICEIYARKLRQRIASKKFQPSKRGFAEISALYKEVNNELQKEQDRYDRETEHSVKTEKQEFWNKKIEGDLEGLKDFSGSEQEVGNK
jgi:hypothetical protein